jgi:hypothetical protein
MKKIYTDEDRQFIIDNQDMPIAEQAKILDRSITSIYSMRAKLIESERKQDKAEAYVDDLVYKLQRMLRKAQREVTV